MKTFDCFPFFNELDLLDLRLRHLSNIVDKFIIVEGEYSHQGRKKKLYFDENKFKGPIAKNLSKDKLNKLNLINGDSVFFI